MEDKPYDYALASRALEIFLELQERLAQEN